MIPFVWERNMINWSIGTSDDGQVIDDDHDADDHYHDNSFDGGEW